MKYKYGLGLLSVLALLVALGQLSFQKTASKEFPAGCYMSFKELQERTPGLNCRLNIYIDTTRGQKMWLHGNEYKLESFGKCISNMRINNKMWAYSDGDSLYINCRTLNIKDMDATNPYCYAKALTYGRYLAFYTFYITEKFDTVAGFVGALGATIATAFDKKMFGRQLQVIDIKTAKLFWVDGAFVAKSLQGFPHLAEEFKGANTNLDSVQLKYLQLANDAQP